MIISQKRLFFKFQENVQFTDKQNKQSWKTLKVKVENLRRQGFVGNNYSISIGKENENISS